MSKAGKKDKGDKAADAAPEDKKEDIGPEPPQPNGDEMRTKVSRLQTQVDALYNQLKVLREAEREERNKRKEDRESKLQEVRDANEGNRSEREKLRDELKDDVSPAITKLQTEINNLMTKGKSLNDHMRGLRSQLGGQRRDRDGDDGPAQRDPNAIPDSLEQINAEMKQIEFNLQSGGGGNIRKEKAAMARLRALEEGKAGVSDRDSAKKQLDRLEGFRTKINEALDERRTKKKALLERRDELRSKLDDINTEQKEKEKAVLGRGGKGKEVKEQSEADRTWARIQELKTEIGETRSGFHTAMDKYKTWERKRNEQLREEREREKKKREEMKTQRENEMKTRREEARKRQVEDERLRRQNPKSEEIQICVSLRNFLQGLTNKKKERPTTAGDSFDPNSAALAKNKGLVAKVREDDWLFGDRTGKNKKKAAPKPKPQPKAGGDEDVAAKSKKLTLSWSQRQGFENVGVRCPGTYADIAETLKTLDERQVKFEGQKRSKADVDAEIDAEEAERANKLAAAAKKTDAADADADAAEDAAEEATS